MNLIFVSGLPKSGTTYLNNILGELPGIDKKHESQLTTVPVGDQGFDSLWNCLQGIQPWYDSQVWNMGGWILSKNETPPTKQEYILGLDKIVAELMRRTVQFLINPNTITCDKLPITEMGSLKALRWAFPQSKIIWMVRDFWDWLISNVFFYYKQARKVGMRHPWFNMNDYIYTDRYNRGGEKYPIHPIRAKRLLEIYHSFDKISKYNVKRIAYEDLVTNPKQTVEKVLKYLKLEFSESDILLALKKGESPPDLMPGFRRSGRIGDYKNYLDDKYIEEVLKE
jgi:hypothetical protein